jgi:hypothetical protein
LTPRKGAIPVTRQFRRAARCHSTGENSVGDSCVSGSTATAIANPHRIRFAIVSAATSMTTNGRNWKTSEILPVVSTHATNGIGGLRVNVLDIK